MKTRFEHDDDRDRRPGGADQSRRAARRLRERHCGLPRRSLRGGSRRRVAVRAAAAGAGVARRARCKPGRPDRAAGALATCPRHGRFRAPAIGGLPHAQYLDACARFRKSARCWCGSTAVLSRADRVRCRGIPASGLPPTATWSWFRSTTGLVRWGFCACRG